MTYVMYTRLIKMCTCQTEKRKNANILQYWYQTKKNTPGATETVYFLQVFNILKTNLANKCNNEMEWNSLSISWDETPS